MSSLSGIGQMPIVGTDISTHSLNGKKVVMHLVWITKYDDVNKSLIVQPFGIKINKDNQAIYSSIIKILDQGLLAVIHSLKNSGKYELATTESIKHKLLAENITVYCKEGECLTKIDSISSIVTYNDEQNSAVRGTLRVWCDTMKPHFKNENVRRGLS